MGSGAPGPSLVQGQSPWPSSPREYPNRPLVGIGVAVLRATKVLLIQRGRPPAEGAWSLPGGAQRVGETAEAAARRELLEETGLAVGEMCLAGYADSVHRDGDGRVRFHYTILDFAAVWRDGEARAGGDAMAVRWADLADMEGLGLPADMRRIVARAAAILAG